MITLYCRQVGQIVVLQADHADPMPSGLFWADLLEPTPEDVAFIKRLAGVEIPTREEMHEIEPSSRLYREGLALFMTASVLNNTDTPRPETRAVTFIVVEGLLITVRHASPLPFQSFIHRILSHPELVSSADMALVELLDAIVDRLADTLETVEGHFSTVSQQVFAANDRAGHDAPDYVEALKSIGLNAIRCAKVDESLVGLSRLLTYFDANLRDTKQKTVRARIKDLQRDIVSLMGYVERHSEKLQMLLDATLGMVNLQQNQIIKIFSVIAVIFLPPTLVASIYGMNFHLMPELDWDFGYPFALVLMVLSAVLPFWLFRRRGWL